jgi:tRNA threonylcarbamoyl adenosine modification protein YeaZ
MLVLAIDTALEACSAAVFDAARDTVVARESRAMARGHAEALMPLIARVLEAAALDFSRVDRIAVTTGPGSFTGMRVGIAAARGFRLASGKPVVGLTTLSVFAAPLIAADTTLPVAVAIDARHDHVYLQVFGSGGRILVTPRVVPIVEAVRLSVGEAPRLAGNAAERLATAWPAGERAPALVEQHAAPDIDWVARLGAMLEENAAPPKPLYLRAPDAQPQHSAQLARR